MPPKPGNLDRSHWPAPHATPWPALSRSQWFAEEVQPHESLLRSYLQGHFPSVRDVDDVVQESYLRIWKAATTLHITSAKAFLFRVARNLALDLIRHERVSPLVSMGSLAGLHVLDDSGTAIERLTREEKIV